MDDGVALGLRLIHIAFGAFWFGAVIMLAAFIEPSIRALGPDGGKFMQHLMGRSRFAAFMSIAGSLTVLSGLTMLWVRRGEGLSSWLETGYGRAIVVGSVAGLIGAVVGFGFNATSAARIARIGREIQSAGGPPRPEQLQAIEALERRLHYGGLVSAVVLSISLLAMAAAKHF